jgi:hypothetical protein
MADHPKPVADIPDDVYLAARQTYNLQHIYLLIGDQFNGLLSGTDLRLLDPLTHSTPEMISRLSMITAFQFAESIPDPTASDASRKRIDWKYALHLPVYHQGFSANSLCEFRQSLYGSAASLQEYQHILDELGKIGLFPKKSRDSLTSSMVLATVCKMSSLLSLYNAMKNALVALIVTVPGWLIDHMPSYWYTRYKTGSKSTQPFFDPENMESEAHKLGTDIQFLLSELSRDPGTAHLITDLPEISLIQRLFLEKYSIVNGQVQWKQPVCAGCSGARSDHFAST